MISVPREYFIAYAPLVSACVAIATTLAVCILVSPHVQRRSNRAVRRWHYVRMLAWLASEENLNQAEDKRNETDPALLILQETLSPPLIRDVTSGTVKERTRSSLHDFIVENFVLRERGWSIPFLMLTTGIVMYGALVLWLGVAEKTVEVLSSEWGEVAMQEVIIFSVDANLHSCNSEYFLPYCALVNHG